MIHHSALLSAAHEAAKLRFQDRGGPRFLPKARPTVDPPTDPGLWSDQAELSGDGDGSGPEDSDLELLAVVIGCTVGLAVLAAGLAMAFGVATPEGGGASADDVFVLAALVVCVGLVGGLAWGVPALLARIIRPIRLRADPPTLLVYASEAPDGGGAPDATAAPRLMTVRARTRTVSVVGWVIGGAVWMAAGVLAQEQVGEVGFTAFCILTALVLCAVGGAAFQRGLVADPSGVTVRNFLRRVRIPWAQVRSIDPVPVDADLGVSALLGSVSGRAGDHRLRFNDQVTAEVPVGRGEPGGYLMTLRETLLSMQRTYGSEGGLPAGVQGSTDNSHTPQASTLPHDIQDTAEDPDTREPGPSAAPSGSTADDISDS